MAGRSGGFEINGQRKDPPSFFGGVFTTVEKGTKLEFLDERHNDGIGNGLRSIIRILKTGLVLRWLRNIGKVEYNNKIILI